MKEAEAFEAVTASFRAAKLEQEAEEADKTSKRESGKEMRVELQATFQQVKSNNQQRAALVSEKTLEVRRIKKVRKQRTFARSSRRSRRL